MSLHTPNRLGSATGEPAWPKESTLLLKGILHAVVGKTPAQLKHVLYPRNELFCIGQTSPILQGKHFRGATGLLENTASTGIQTSTEMRSPGLAGFPCGRGYCSKCKAFLNCRQFVVKYVFGYLMLCCVQSCRKLFIFCVPIQFFAAQPHNFLVMHIGAHVIGLPPLPPY